ncbi:MAG: ComEC family competence protein [Candidatus Taylorbacteria bacterium]|nr:ComEC family competence protein [Candidatus Taylorbacteria bacterium]
MNDRVLHSVLFGFIAGIFFRSFVSVGVSFSFFTVLLSIALGAVLFLYTPKESRGAPIFLLPLFVLALGMGMLRYDVADRPSVTDVLDTSVGKQVVLEGVIDDEPDEREKVTRLVITSTRVDEVRAVTRVLITTETVPPYAYGDRVVLTGKLEEPENFTDEATLREVDYKSYLSKDGVYYEMFKPNIEVLAHNERNTVLSTLFSFKQAFIENLNQVIREPHVALLGGLIVGAKHSLGKKLLDDFRTVGIIHIIVLSGYNITIIAYFIEWLFSRLRKNLRLTLASIGMVLFALMVGASATVVRATIMALLVILAKATGRVYTVTRALLVAGFFMLLHNPHILVFDVSFQLSFLATVGLIYLSPLVTDRVTWITERWHFREIVVATIATQLFVLPFILYKTGLFSVVALPVNLLILTTIPLTMLFGFLAGMIGFVSLTLSLPFAWVAHGLLSYELAVVEWFARIPFASFTIGSFPLWLMLSLYALYGIGFLILQKKTEKVDTISL